MTPHRFFSILVLICFLLTSLGPRSVAYAQSASELPVPGTMVNLSPAFEPVLIKGLKIHPENPFLFDFIVDTGSDASLRTDSLSTRQALKNQSDTLIKYFLTSMTIPAKDLWVNLSPYEKNRIIAPNLGQTQMGRDMLAEDYILKQLTASLIYPEKSLGKTFWDEVYTKARQIYGTAQVPVNTFNKVWIVADSADIFERGNVAYVTKTHLKVMLEEDYLALSHHAVAHKDISSVGASIVRQIILPQIEKEVNEGKNFAPLRQMFYTVVLANWYKTALKGAVLTQIYGNKSKVKVGINEDDPQANEKIFERYLKAYKKGVFNYIKDDADPSGAQAMPRRYFSGGLDWTKPHIHNDPSLQRASRQGNLYDLKTSMAMTTANGMSTSISEILKSLLSRHWQDLLPSFMLDTGLVHSIRPGSQALKQLESQLKAKSSHSVYVVERNPAGELTLTKRPFNDKKSKRALDQISGQILEQGWLLHLSGENDDTWVLIFRDQKELLNGLGNGAGKFFNALPAVSANDDRTQILRQLTTAADVNNLLTPRVLGILGSVKGAIPEAMSEIYVINPDGTLNQTVHTAQGALDFLRDRPEFAVTYKRCEMPWREKVVLPVLFLRTKTVAGKPQTAAVPASMKQAPPLASTYVISSARVDEFLDQERGPYFFKPELLAGLKKFFQGEISIKDAENVIKSDDEGIYSFDGTVTIANIRRWLASMTMALQAGLSFEAVRYLVNQSDEDWKDQKEGIAAKLAEDNSLDKVTARYIVSAISQLAAQDDKNRLKVVLSGHVLGISRVQLALTVYQISKKKVEEQTKAQQQQQQNPVPEKFPRDVSISEILGQMASKFPEIKAHDIRELLGELWRWQGGGDIYTFRQIPDFEAAMQDSAQITNGGIDLSRSKVNITRQGQGLQMQFNAATIARFKNQDFDGLEFKIQSIAPASDLPWS